MEKFKSRKYHLTSKLVLLKAINDIYPAFQVVFRNSLNNGVYVTINGKNYITEEEIKKIEDRMSEIVAEKKAIKKIQFTSEEITEKHLESIREDLKELLETTGIISFLYMN